MRGCRVGQLRDRVGRLADWAFGRLWQGSARQLPAATGGTAPCHACRLARLRCTWAQQSALLEQQVPENLGCQITSICEIQPRPQERRMHHRLGTSAFAFSGSHAVHQRSRQHNLQVGGQLCLLRAWSQVSGDTLSARAPTTHGFAPVVCRPRLGPLLDGGPA